MKYVMMVIGLFLMGCSGDTKTYNTYDENITIDEPYPIPDGLVVIVDTATNSTISTDVDNQTITIDCGGSCGDINIGIPL